MSIIVNCLFKLYLMFNLHKRVSFFVFLLCWFSKSLKCLNSFFFSSHYLYCISHWKYVNFGFKNHSFWVCLVATVLFLASFNLTFHSFFFLCRSFSPSNPMLIHSPLPSPLPLTHSNGSINFPNLHAISQWILIHSSKHCMMNWKWQRFLSRLINLCSSQKN